jgi:WD40 repeat protein
MKDFSQHVSGNENSDITWITDIPAPVTSLLVRRDSALLVGDMSGFVHHLDFFKRKAVVGASVRCSSNRGIQKMMELNDGRILTSEKGGVHEALMLRIFNQALGICELVLRGSIGELRAVIQLHNGSIATCSGMDHVRVWDIKNNRSSTVRGVTVGSSCALVTSFALLRSHCLVSAHELGTIWIWNDTATLRRFRVQCHSGPVVSMCVLGDGVTIVSGGRNSTLKLWNSQSWCSPNTSTCVKDLTPNLLESSTKRLNDDDPDPYNAANAEEKDSTHMGNNGSLDVAFKLSINAEDYRLPPISIDYLHVLGDGVTIVTSSKTASVIHTWCF